MQGEDLKKIFSKHIAKVLDCMELAGENAKLMSVVKGQLWELFEETKQSTGENKWSEEKE